MKIAVALKQLFSLFILTLFFVFNLNAQIYYAGNNFNTSYDINPDTLLNYFGTGGGSSGAEDYYINLFGNANPDIRIRANSSGGLGNGSYFINITSLDTDVFIRFKRWDSVYNSIGSYWLSAKVAMPLSYGDSINSFESIWDNATLALTENSGGMGTYLNVADWIDSSDRYIAIAYITSSDTSYAWLRVQCPNSGNCYLKDYSSNQATGISYSEQIKSIIIYPNPSQNYIQTGLMPDREKEKFYYKIHSALGILVQESYLPEDGKIDVQKVNSGLYFLSITNQKNQYKSTFIKE